MRGEGVYLDENPGIRIERTKKEVSKMGQPSNWDGIYPAACVIYKDKSCREVDEGAYRDHVSGLLAQKGISGLFVSSAHEGLSMDEKVKVLKIAKEEARGK